MNAKEQPLISVIAPVYNVKKVSARVSGQPAGADLPEF